MQRYFRHSGTIFLFNIIGRPKTFWNSQKQKNKNKNKTWNKEVEEQKTRKVEKRICAQVIGQSEYLLSRKRHRPCNHLIKSMYDDIHRTFSSEKLQVWVSHIPHTISLLFVFCSLCCFLILEITHYKQVQMSLRPFRGNYYQTFKHVHGCDSSHTTIYIVITIVCYFVDGTVFQLLVNEGALWL